MHNVWMVRLATDVVMEKQIPRVQNRKLSKILADGINVMSEKKIVYTGEINYNFLKLLFCICLVRNQLDYAYDDCFASHSFDMW